MLFTHIGEGGVNLASRMAPDIVGNQNSSRLGHLFQPGGDVYAVAVYVVSLDNDIAEIYPYSQNDLARFAGQLFLNGEGAFDRIHDGGEFHQRPVAHQLDDPAAPGFDFGIEDLAAMGLERGQRTGFVLCHKPGIAHHVCGQYCSKSARHSLSPSQTA